MAKLLSIRPQSYSIRLISLQFLTFAAIGMAWPYISLYLVDLEFSGTLIGTLASVGAVLSLVLTPLLNSLADHLLLHRRLLMIYLGGFALSLIIFASSRVQIVVIFGFLLMKLTVSPSIALGTQMTMTQLLRQGKAILGQMRSFAALGFTVASLLAGAMFAAGGYPLLFGTGAVLVLISIQMSTVFPDKPKRKTQDARRPRTARNRGFYVLIASQFFIFMGVQNAFQFLFIHLSQNLGVATADIGLWAALLAGVEIPFFLLLDAIMPRVRMRTAYIVSALGMAAFLVLLGLVQTTPALALLLVFRGFTWPAIHLSSYTLVAEISHPHNVATNQAIMQVTMPAIALLLTGSFFGWIFDHLGAGAFFGLSALVCAIGATIVIAGFRFFETKQAATA
ncbi:MAG: MFS transporter [Chloroflexota bacterium]|nr:MFS transporter [Chloroflexota bacterium]